MKWYEKLWQWLSIFFAGIIAGIVIFIKFLDTPENQITIGKIKNKNVKGTASIDVNVKQQQDNTKSNTDIKQKKNKFLGIFKRKQ
jgi:hypothetical protein